MNITLRYDDGGVQRALDLTIDSLKDLKPILKRFSAYKRKKVQQVFEAQGPGWKPLAEDTQAARMGRMHAIAEKIRSGKMRNLERRVANEGSRAKRQLLKSQADKAAYEQGSKASALRQRRERTAARQEAKAAELQRLMGGGYAPLAKPNAKLLERIGRRHEAADEKVKRLEDGELLGQIANSIEAEIEAAALTIKSRIPWAGAHNEGATVGRGATLPKREFLAWTAEDMQILGEIAQDYMLEKLKSQ